jgi:hypothetical protein
MVGAATVLPRYIFGALGRRCFGSGPPCLHTNVGGDVRTLVATGLFATAVCLGAAPAWGQHSPRIADAAELGVEVILAEHVTSFAGILQTPIGPRTDVRGGIGIADPDGGDSDVFLTGGLRGLVSRRSSRFPLDIALDGQLDIFLVDDTAVTLAFGASFGAPAGRGGLLVPYVEPIILIASDGDTHTDLAVRLGADYALSPTVDLRGDVVIGDDTQFRAALYFQFGR